VICLKENILLWSSLNDMNFCVGIILIFLMLYGRQRIELIDEGK
jgi:hypothetical protein